MYTSDEIMNRNYYYNNGILFCEKVSVEEIARETGTPVYIYSKAVLREKYNQLAKAFSNIDTTVCFSVKSCPTMAILATLCELGSGFDIVSGGELFRVVQCGCSTSKVVYSGVGKTDKEIRYGLERGIFLFNIESEEELENINKLAGEMGTIAPIGIRLNPDVDPKTHRKTTTGKKENKFGVDFVIAERIARNIDKYKSVKLKSLGVHLGSPINSTEPYSEALDKILEFINENSEYLKTIEYIDAGGGFGLIYNNETVPDFTDYAESIIPRVRKAGCRLILEPGRCIAGNAGILAGTVLYRKTNGTKNFVIVDAGMHSLIRPAMYGAYHGIWPVKSDLNPELPSGRISDSILLESIDLAGPICESSDVFCENRLLPKMNRGDLVSIFSAGAYGFTMSFNYNSHPRPTEVLVEGDKWKVIHKPEDWESLVYRE